MTTTKITLAESSVSLGKVTGKRRWKSRLIAQGPGSSGYYTEGALRDFGPAAFPAGTKINVDHQSFTEYLDQPAGSLKTLAGIVASTPEYTEGPDSVMGLYAEVEFSEEWGPFVEQFGPFVGLSIQAQGFGEEFNDEGQRIVEGFVPSVLNTVDLVTAPGARGKLFEAVESYKESSKSDKMTLDSLTNVKEDVSRKEDGMTPEEIAEFKEAVVTAVTSAMTEGLTKIQESLKPAEPEATEAPSTAEVTEALIEADLPKAFRVRAVEAIADGKTVAEAIEAQKTLLTEAREGFAAPDADSPGVVRTSEAASSRVNVSGWSN